VASFLTPYISSDLMALGFITTGTVLFPFNVRI
jgi:hypothetical protein